MENETLSEKESLEIISKMIRSAKTHLSDDGIYYSLWGWAVLIAALINFFLMQIDYARPWIGWAVLMPLCGITVMIVGRNRSKHSRVKTFVEEYMNYLWLAFGITLFIILFFTEKIGPENTYPIIMLLYGIGTFVSGGALRFMPLKIGGFICWTFAIASFFLPFQYQLLMIAGAVLLAYIIPGYLLQRKYRAELKNE